MADTFNINLEFTGDGTFQTQYGESDGFTTDFGSTQFVTTSDHRELTHRDADAQHPIGSITNLEGELEVRPDEYLSNIDIYEILNS